MNRRNFALLTASGGAAVIGRSSIAATLVQGDWVQNPLVHVGRSYSLPNGAVLTLDRVDAVDGDSRLSQWQLRFVSQAPLAEGIHDLKCPIRGEITSLFLQSRGVHAWACISRLA
jgi:hypothetical protein